MCLGHERLCVCGKTCDPRLEPIACVQSHAAPTYIRSGLNPVPRSLMLGARARAPRGMGPILIRGVSQPCPATVTHPPWNWQVLLVFKFGGVGVDQRVLNTAPAGTRPVSR